MNVFFLIQEESCRVRAVLQAERDESVSRNKKLARQCDKLAVQLTDSRAQLRDLNAQLADAAEYKVPINRSHFDGVA
jgi:hypothetical protein